MGWGLILIGLIGAFALIAPSAAQSLVSASGRGFESAMRYAGRELKARGPGALAAMGRGMGRGFVALVYALWGALRWTGRELWLAFGVVGEQWRESRRGERQPSRHTSDVPAPPPMPQPRVAQTEPAWPPLAESVEEEPVEPVVERPSAPPAPSVPSTLRTLDRTAADGWRLPPIELLDEDPATTLRSGAGEQARIIVETLASFGVDASVTQINEGPSITQFGVEPGWEIKTRLTPIKDESGAPVLDEHRQTRMQAEEVSRTRVRVNRITRLGRRPGAGAGRALDPDRGSGAGPADCRGSRCRTRIRGSWRCGGLIESEEFSQMAAQGGLPIALGRDVTGNPVIADLTRMPHVLIAGATGSGKSVCINTIISSLLMQKSPEEVRLILVDPKRVELTGYGSAPHLAFSHVVTEPDEVVSVLGVVVAEMDRRYRKLEESKARNIVAFNSLPAIEKRMPYWVVVLDELADMMMAAAAEVEGQIVRLAQLARAVGIHLVIATQRPSVDVVTGLIKANFPTRIAFATTSQTDARVIMDRAGAEKLMGRGDMLYMSSDSIKPRRVQGAFVSDGEIERLLESWTGHRQAATERSSLDEVLEELSEETPSAVEEAEARAAQSELRSLTSTLESVLEADVVVEAGPGAATPPPQSLRDSSPLEGGSGELDTRLGEATALAREYERVSASLLQRRMRVGRPRAERLIEQLAEAGVIEQSDGGRSRRVLARLK